MKRILSLLLAALIVCSAGAAFGEEPAQEDLVLQVSVSSAMLNSVLLDVSGVVDVFSLELNGVRYDARLTDPNSNREVTPDTAAPMVAAYTGDLRAAQLADQAVAEGYDKADLLIKEASLWVKSEGSEYARLYDRGLYASKYNVQLAGQDFELTDTHKNSRITLHVDKVDSFRDKEVPKEKEKSAKPLDVC